MLAIRTSKRGADLTAGDRLPGVDWRRFPRKLDCQKYFGLYPAVIQMAPAKAIMQNLSRLIEFVKFQVAAILTVVKI